MNYCTLILVDESTNEEFENITLEMVPTYNVGETFTLVIENMDKAFWEVEPGVSVWEILKIEHELKVNYASNKKVYQYMYITLTLKKINTL